MELLQLQYFCAVAQCESMTRAAEKLMISQPSLSKTIIKLEKELGVPLFDRVRGKIILNEYGKALYEKVLEGLAHLEDGVHEVQDMSRTGQRQLTLLATAGTCFIGDMLHAFHQSHPDIQVSVDRLQHSGQTPSSSFDIALSESTSVIKGYESLKVLEEPLVLAVPPGHALASRHEIDLAEAARYKFISYPKGRNTRSHLDRLSKEAGFTPDIVTEVDHTSNYRAFSQMGLALISYSAYHFAYSDLVSCVNIRSPRCVREIALSWNPERYLPLAAQRFRDFAVSYFRQLQSLMPPV